MVIPNVGCAGVIQSMRVTGFFPRQDLGEKLRKENELCKLFRKNVGSAVQRRNRALGVRKDGRRATHEFSLAG